MKHKRLIIVLGLLTLTTSISAQNFTRRGFALGADRDTLQYIIASPFDNWYMTVGGGVQTFIGNTPDPQACWNTVDFGGRIEIGKWVIPDVSVGLRLGVTSVHTQSLHGGNNPWSDVSNPIMYEGAEYTYYPIGVTSLYAQAIVTFDWTNFLSGYEAGKRKRWHVYTPVGFGGIALVGGIVNPNFVNRLNNDAGEEVAKLGDGRKNLELAFSGGIMGEYFASKHLSFNASLELMGARGSLDDYNYNLDADKRRIDLIPTFNIGVKFNILDEVTKQDPYTRRATRSKVNHEFLAFGSRNTVSNLTGRIERLNGRIDSIQNLSDQREAQDSEKLADLQNELDSLLVQLDSAQANMANGYGARNIIEDLLNANEVLGLPATIVYYRLDKYDIDYNGYMKLQRFAKTVNTLDDTLEYFIVGAADSITGTIRHNQWLSQRRCEAAYNVLVNEYHVNENQFVLVPVGGIMEYDPQEYNRIALIIQRTPETEAIVDRWMRHKGRGEKTIVHP